MYLLSKLNELILWFYWKTWKNRHLNQSETAQPLVQDIFDIRQLDHGWYVYNINIGIVIMFKLNDNEVYLLFNRPIQAKCIALVTNSCLELETAMVPIVNRGWQLFTDNKYWKSFSKLFHNTQRLRLVFQHLTQYLSGYNPMIE